MGAIGIFDSGIGGLTVLKALREALPLESFEYLGDTARLPYGTKSAETIRLYLEQNVKFLLKREVKAIIVACNSASSVLHENHWDGVPIYGVILPGAEAAEAATRNRHIGVLGTRATIESGAYVKALMALDPGLEVTQQACPLLVPLVEEGWAEDEVTQLVLSRYLKLPLKHEIDTLVLGCTHYPVLKQEIAQLVGPGITLVDSAQVVSARLSADLQSGKIKASSSLPTTRIWTTDTNHSFREVGERILAPYTIDDWQLADIRPT